MPKLIILFYSLLTILFWQVSANAENIDENVVKQLQGRIDNIFLRWDDRWSYDQYIEESAIINSIKKSDYADDRQVVSGYFSVIRSFLTTHRVKVQFSAKVKFTNAGVKITELCYFDSTAPNSEDCINPDNPASFS